MLKKLLIKTYNQMEFQIQQNLTNKLILLIMYEEKNRRFWLVRAGYVNGTLSSEKILNENSVE